MRATIVDVNARRDALVDVLVEAKRAAVAAAAYKKARLALEAAQTRLKQVIEEQQ